MKHFASPSFWSAYEALPSAVRVLADKNFEFLKADPKHPALHINHVGLYWSTRFGLHYGAFDVEAEDGLVWFWIGSHADYDKLVG